MRSQYKKLFVASLLLTAILFCYDILYRHPDLNTKQLLFEIFVYGIAYTLMTFAIAGGLYFCISKLRRAIGKDRQDN